MDEKIIKYYQNSLTPSERIELLKEAFSNAELKSKMVDYQNMHSVLRLSPENINRKLGKLKYAQFMNRKTSRNKGSLLFSIMRYAAIVIILVVSTWMLAYSYLSTLSQLNVVALQQELYVPAGQRARLTLPDGTNVWLNANSTLSYPSVFQKERRVLLSGEAFFEVAKNKDIPFIVSANAVDIKALGTQFNVYSYPDADYVGVYLLEGSVKAYYPDHESTGITLTPNQYLVRKNGAFKFETMDPDNLRWKEGFYTFKKQRLEEIIEKLELYYDVEILVQDPDILNYKYTGKFRQRDGVLEILRIIQRIHQFKIVKNEEENQIVLKK